MPRKRRVEAMKRTKKDMTLCPRLSGFVVEKIRTAWEG